MKSKVKVSNKTPHVLAFSVVNTAAQTKTKTNQHIPLEGNKHSPVQFYSRARAGNSTASVSIKVSSPTVIVI